MRFLFYVTLAAAMATAHAAAPTPVIYKCVAENGKVTYSESPCYGETWHRFGAPAEKPAREPAASQPTSPPTPAPKASARPRVVKLPTPP